MKKRKKNDKIEEILLQGLIEHKELTTKELFLFLKYHLNDRSFGYTIGTVSAILIKLKRENIVKQTSQYPSVWRMK